MIELPRLGLAVASNGPEPSMAGLALLAGLTSRRCQVQHFRAKACPTSTGVIRQITGFPGRHLDAWLMPPEVCRQVFARGARNASLAVVEGTLDEQASRLPNDCAGYNRPGGLGPIAEALDLPTIAVVSCPRWGDFHLPKLPGGVDAILIDDLDDPGDFERLKHLVALLTRKPVVGAVESLPAIRRALAEIAPNQPIPEGLIDPLGASFLRFADLGVISDLSKSRPFVLQCTVSRPQDKPRVRVAYALDEAFGGYFPDTLETLEALGAELCDFSPLRDEVLPPAVDLVLIGCGVPDQFAETLAANQCMISALKSHVCQGRRIYSEGGGTAYLGRSMILRDRVVPGVGILPIIAELRTDPVPPIPVERIIARDGWLGLKGTVVRGYRTGRWNLHPTEIDSHCQNCYGTLTDEGDLTFHHHAVGSLIHLHMGALPEVVSAFVGVHRPSLNLPKTRFER